MRYLQLFFLLIISCNAKETAHALLHNQLIATDLRMLRVFRAVVEAGGFAAAEVELNVSRAAISMTIANLEARLGLRLCQRGRAGFALSPEGEHVYEYTQQLLSSMEDFRSQVNGLHERLQGDLNIGITDNLVTIPHMIITNALKGLKRRSHQVNINIHMIAPHDVEVGVLDNRLHVGVVPDVRRRTGLNYRSLYDERSMLYCASNHPLFTLDDKSISASVLAKQDAVFPAYAQTPEIKSMLQRFKTAATSTGREGIAFLILSDEFIGFLPEHYASQWVNSGRLRAICPEQIFFTTQFAIITRKSVSPNLVLRSFLAELQQLGVSSSGNRNKWPDQVIDRARNAT